MLYPHTRKEWQMKNEIPRKIITSGANSKLYRENFERVFGNEKKEDLTEVELDLDKDVVVFLEKYAKDNQISFNDACIEMIKSQLDKWDEEIVGELKEEIETGNQEYRNQK